MARIMQLALNMMRSTPPVNRVLSLVLSASLVHFNAWAEAGAAGLLNREASLIHPWAATDIGSLQPPAGWEAQFHPKIARHTQFELVLLDGAPALSMKADASYGTWVHRFTAPIEIGELEWSWSVGEQPTGANLQIKEGDDTAAKLCLFVEIDESTLGLGTRLALGAARTVSGENLPAATLCYVWGTPKEQVNQIFANPYTELVINWILTTDGPSRAWRAEKRDVQADVRRVFGMQLPSGNVRITALAIGSDADNTRSKAVAFFRQPQAYKPRTP